MAGLLDMTEDPQTMGLLSLGLGMLNSKGGNALTALGQAGPGALEAMRQVKLDQQRKEQLKQQQAMQALQMQQAQMSLAEAQRAQQERQRQQDFLQNLPSPQMAAVSQTLAGGGGPSVANAGKVPAVDPMQQLMFGAVKSGALPLSAYITSMQKDETPIALGEGGKLVTRAGRELAANPKAPDLNSLVVMGPDGKPMLNQLAFNAKRDLARAGASSVSVNTDNLGLKPKDRFDMEGKLADDFKGVTKLDNLVLSAASKVKTALAQPGALKDQAAIYSLAKMLDPEGAVREADYAAISNIAGLGDRLRNYLNRLATGEQLTDTQRQEMIGMMAAFEKVASRRIASAKADFSTQAQRYNLRPESVFSGSPTLAPEELAGPIPKPARLRRWNPTAQKFEEVGG